MAQDTIFEMIYTPDPNTTKLTPPQEEAFLKWAEQSGIRDLDHPYSFYDYRGFWKESEGKPWRFGHDHAPDTYKQPGHLTFSNESIYSNDENPGGSWVPGTDIFQSPDGRTIDMNDPSQADPFREEYEENLKHLFAGPQRPR
jgi:hypothetical protein